MFRAIANTVKSVFGPQQKREVDDSDGRDTASEWMVPEWTIKAKFRYSFYRLGIGSSLASITLAVIKLSSLHLLGSLFLFICFLLLVFLHLNTLFTAKSWSIYSMILIAVGYCLSIYLALPKVVELPMWLFSLLY